MIFPLDASTRDRSSPLPLTHPLSHGARAPFAGHIFLAAALAACAGTQGNEASQESTDELSTVKPGSASGATKLSVPAHISTLRSDPHVIAGYLDVTHYGADPTGEKDSTAAFQSALDDAGSNASGSIGATMVVYVPAGTYLISHTVTGYQIFNGSNTNRVNAKFGAGNGLLAPTLVGPGTGPRPTIVLKDGVFTNAASPQPMLHMVNTPNAGKGGCGGQWAGTTAVGCFDILFNTVVRDIDFKVGKNPGAIGVQFYSAQMSYMQNVKVDATGGYAGIQGAPATEAWVNIEVDGGEYGIVVDRTAGTSAIAGLILENQTVAGVRAAAVGDLSITGFSIHETNPAATGVLTHSPINQGGMLSMIDGQITTTNLPAIDNVGGFSVYLNNVYAKAPKALIVNGTAMVAANGQTQEIAEYSHADQTTNPAGDGYARAAAIVIDDEKQDADFGPVYGHATAPPTDLVSRNLPAQMPWAFDANVAWVTDYGADPTGASDSTTAFRRAVAAAHAAGSDEVFVPRGKYTLSGTVVLNPNTKFFGLPGGFSQLRAPDWNTEGKVAFLLQVGDAAGNPAGTKAGKAIVSDISIYLATAGTATTSAKDQSYVAAVHWETGSASVANQIYIAYQYNQGLDVTSPPARNIVQVDDGGGGRWYGLQIAGDYGPNAPGGYPFLVTSTATAMSIYGSNIEHAAGHSFYGFVNASNVRVLGAKAEDGNTLHWFYLSGASNIMISGITNHDTGLDVVVTGGSSHVNVNTTGLYAVTKFTNPRITDATAAYSFADNYALFKVGSFDDSVFSRR